jgi:hypothetical protein
MKRQLRGSVVALALWLLSATTLHADFLFNVTVDTSKLSSDLNLNGPFGIDFQLVQGTPGVSNTATISNIDLGGGAAVGSPALTNSSGSLTNGVALNDSNFFSDFNQQFTPGSTLSFTVDLTTNVGTLTPDEFSFSLLENYGTASEGNIPTTAPGGADTLLAVNITSSTPLINVYSGSDPSGDPPAPQASVVPAPSAGMLSVVGLASLALAAGWRRLRRRVVLAA